MNQAPLVCPLCNKPVDSLHHELEMQILQQIKTRNPQWVMANGACPPCVEHYRGLDSTSPLGEP